MKKVTATAVSKIPHSKRKHKQLEFFIAYDIMGHEIEYGSWGQTTCNYYNSSDTAGMTLSVGCSWDYTKISNVDFSFYDLNGKKVREETWMYKNDIKYYKLGYTNYYYNLKGLLQNEIIYDSQDSIRKTKTYRYDDAWNNIEIIDSNFSGYNPKLSIHKIVNKFDQNIGIISKAEYIDGKLLLKKIFLYKDEVETQLRYDNEKDSVSLWSITEIMYDRYTTDSGKQKKQVFEKIIHGRETHDIYKYNRDGLKERIDHYDGLDLTNYTKFDYEFF